MKKNKTLKIIIIVVLVLIAIVAVYIMRNRMMTKKQYKDKSVEQIKNDDKLEEIKKKIEKSIGLEEIKKANKEAAANRIELTEEKKERTIEELKQTEQELKELAQNQV